MIPLDLAVDTAGSFCSVALRSAALRSSVSDISASEIDSRAELNTVPPGIGYCASTLAVPIMSVQSEGQGDHFERLPELVDELLQRSCCEARNISRVVVGTGPGSFTGIRIGMSFAKGLAWANRARLVGGCSFRAAAIAESHSVLPGGLIAVVSDARRGEVFFGTFRRSAHGVEAVEPVQILSVSDAQARCERVVCAVTPQRGFLPWRLSEGIAYNDTPATAVGLLDGLIEGASVGVGLADFDMARMQEVVPTYLREVSAQTIAERAAAQIGRDR